MNDIDLFRSQVGAPVVGDCDGEYHHDNRKNVLQWTFPVIDQSNKSGSMEFTIAGHPDDFFPVDVNFVSKKSFTDLQVSGCKMIPGSPQDLLRNTFLRVEFRIVVH